MGEFLDRIVQRRTAPEAVAHRIALYLSSDEKRAVVTEAGDDVYFYSVIYERTGQNRKVDFFGANGRKIVIDAMIILRDLGKIERTYGIVDRDFNFEDPEYLLDGHCLVLGVYSYENLFADAEMLKRLGRVFFDLEVNGEDEEVWADLVDGFFSNIDKVLLKEHAEALWCRRNGKPCNLSNFKVCTNVSILPTGAIERKPDTNERFLAETSTDLTEALASDLSLCEGELADKAWPRAFRGHYFWSLFVRLLNNFRTLLDARRKAAGVSRARTRSELSERHAIEAAAVFLPIPPILSDFFATVAQ